MPVETVTEVARCQARGDLTVTGRSTIPGLRVEATDGPFATGAGPLVSGTTVGPTMAMAGHLARGDVLTGPGAPLVRALLTHPP